MVGAPHPTAWPAYQYPCHSSWGGCGVGCADLLLGVGKGHPDVPWRQAQDVCGLVDGEFVPCTQQQAGALERRQPVEGGADSVALTVLARSVGVRVGPMLLVVGCDMDPG